MWTDGHYVTFRNFTNASKKGVVGVGANCSQESQVRQLSDSQFPLLFLETEATCCSTPLVSFTKQHGVTSQKKAIFTVTIVKISDLTTGTTYSV
jgi:hypothetical protein